MKYRVDFGTDFSKNAFSSSAVLNSLNFLLTLDNEEWRMNNTVFEVHLFLLVYLFPLCTKAQLLYFRWDTLVFKHMFSFEAVVVYYYYTA